MLTWIAGLWGPRRPAREGDALREERRRLEEILDYYRDFGFDDLAADTVGEIARLARRIRALDLRQGRRPSTA